MYFKYIRVHVKWTFLSVSPSPLTYYIDLVGSAIVKNSRISLPNWYKTRLCSKAKPTSDTYLCCNTNAVIYSQIKKCFSAQMASSHCLLFATKKRKSPPPRFQHLCNLNIFRVLLCRRFHFFWWDAITLNTGTALNLPR